MKNVTESSQAGKLTELSRVVRLGNVRVLLKSSDVMNVKLEDILGVFFLRSLAGLLGCGLSLFKLLLIDIKTELLGHDASQVDGETIGIIQTPDVRPIEGFEPLFTSLGGILVKKLLTTI
jgi:hypothetical protein